MDLVRNSGLALSLHHSRRAARKIDESQFLLTNFESLNDSREIVYGLEAIASRVEELISGESNTIKSQFDVVLERLRNARATFELHPDLYGKSSVTVFSMSEAANDLPQWKAYSRHGEGFALEINRKTLMEVLNQPENVGIELKQCLYVDVDHEDMDGAHMDPELRSLIDEMVRPFIEEIRSTGVAINLKDNLWSKSERLAARIKHPGFRAEREWRLVRSHVGVNEMKTRKLGGRLRSVLACKWDYTSSRPDLESHHRPKQQCRGGSDGDCAASGTARPFLEADRVQQDPVSRRLAFWRVFR